MPGFKRHRESQEDLCVSDEEGGAGELGRAPSTH